MAAASLAVRVSAQIDDLQKGFADVTKTLDGFKKDFNKTSTDVQKSVDGMSKGMTGFSTTAQTSKKTFDSIGKSLTDLGGSFGAVGTFIGKATGAFGTLATTLGPIGLAIAGVTVAVTGVIAAFNLLQSAATAAFDFLKGAVTNTAALGEELFDLSNKIGVSVESLSALKFVAAQTGTSLDAISGAVFKMSANIGKGTKDTSAAIKGLGLSLEDLSKQAPEQAFASILQSINKLPSASAQAAAGVAVFGKSFKEISQLKGENLDELIAKAKELGLVMETETAVAADMLGDKMLELQGIFDGVQQQIGAKLIPVVLTFAELLVGIVSDAVKIFGQAFGSTGEGFKTFVVAIGTGTATVVRFFAFMVDGFAAWGIAAVANFAIVGTAFLDFADRVVSVGKDLDALFNFGRQQGLFAGLQTAIGVARSGFDTLGGAALKTGVAIRQVAQDIDRTSAAIAADFGSIFEGVQAKISKAADEMRKKLGAIGIGAKEGADAAAKALDSLVNQLTGKTVLAEAIKWEAALKVVGKEFHRLTDKDAKQFLGVVDEITDRFGSLEAAGVSGLKNIAVVLRALTSKGQTIELPIIPTMSTQTLAAVVAKAQPPQMILPIIPQMSDATLATIGVQISKARIDWAERARAFVEDLKNIGLDAAHGLAEALGQGIRTGDWSQLENNLKAVLANALGNAAAAAVNLIVPGLGSALAPLFSALADKLLGALGLGTKGRDAVKEFAASMGGFDAVRDKLRELGAEGERLWVSLTQGTGRGNAAQAAANIDAITAALERAEAGMKKFTDGAMARIKAFAASFKTAANESVAALKKLIDAELPELEMGVDETAARKKLGTTFDDLRKLVSAEAPELKMGIDEANARKQLDGFIDTVAARRNEIQAEFNLLGLYAGTAFAETLRDKGLAEAIRVAGPLFDELIALSAEFGLTLEGSAAGFAAFFETAKQNEDVVNALEGITLMIQGAGDAAFLTQELFSAFSTDAVAQFEKLRERGVDANSAMALMQPTLQALWEAQARFGLETDAATQALIDQGVEQGIVGANMRDVNEKILDVLVAIAKVFKADIPAGLDATAQKSNLTAAAMARDFDSAARKAQNALSGISVPPIDVDVNFNVGDVPGVPGLQVPQLASGGLVTKPTLAVIGERGPELVIPLQRLREMAFLDGLRDRYGIPGLQHGGIVRSPTLALVGESGPEAVIPLSQMGSQGSDTTIILEIDGRTFAEVVCPHLPGAVNRLGLGF